MLYFKFQLLGNVLYWADKLSEDKKVCPRRFQLLGNVLYWADLELGGDVKKPLSFSCWEMCYTGLTMIPQAGHFLAVGFSCWEMCYTGLTQGC